MELFRASPGALGLLLLAGNVSASPFPTRDQNPLLAGLGIPLPMASQLASAGSWELAADLNWANSSVVQGAGNEVLIVDAETLELRMSIARALSDRWTVQLQLPYRYTGAGSLDSFIDSWHDFFGLPEGARPDLPRDDFRIGYERDDTVAFDYRESSEGVGDISIDLGYQWIPQTDASLAAWLSLKLPTGDAEKFNGSGAADIALILAGERRFADNWSAFGQVSVTYLGEGELLPTLQNDIVWSAMAGLGVDVWRGLELKLQFDAHSAAFDGTGLDYLSENVILTVGGAWKFQSGWRLDVGVSEDIVVDASPDVVFVIGLRKSR